MYKTAMLALALLISAAWSQAQQGYPSPEEGKTPSDPSGLTTLNGCLQNDNGQYTLTENGTLHRLSGAAKKLKSHVGHQVELTGKPSSRTIDNTPPGGASSVILQYVFEVKTVKDVADTCTAN